LNYNSGLDALNALNATSESAGGGMEFTSFKSGSSFKVRVLGQTDFIHFRSFGIFKQVNSFSAKNPATYNAKGYPQDNLGAWDKAAEYYSKLAFDTSDKDKQTELRNEAYKYRAKERFAMGFIDLDTGEPIIIDVSKPQALAIHTVIRKNEKKLAKVAFELEKNGQGTSTSVLLSPLSLDQEDDEVTEKQRENYAKYDGKAFDMTLFDGLLYEADDAEQLTLLTQAGFDIALIGASKTATDASATTAGGEIAEEDLPF